MIKIAQATSRGQITLPKKWRDKFENDCYKMEIKENEIIIRPMELRKGFLEELAEASREAKEGKVVTQEELKKKYGL